MDEDLLHVSTSVEPDGGLTVVVRGYLDEAGGIELRREAGAALEAGHTRLRIDLEKVVLFNCAGARHLVAVLEATRDRDERVELVGVRPPLQRLIDFAA